MPHGLTVVIPCKNEARHLAAAVASVRPIADEVLVADSGSTDGTIELAKGLGCRVVQREYRTSGDFKNWAIPQAEHEWVMILDADERATPQLVGEVRRLLDNGPTADGYLVPRRNFFYDRPVRFGAWRPTCLMRLFRRDLGRYVGRTDHAEVVVSTGRVGQLVAPLDHLAMEGYDRYLPKLYRYADVQARLWRSEGRRANLRQLLFRGPLRFLHDYFIRGGVRDGAVGLQAAVLVAYGSYLKQARLWELEKQGESAGEPASVAPPLDRAA